LLLLLLVNACGLLITKFAGVVAAFVVVVLAAVLLLLVNTCGLLITKFAGVVVAFVVVVLAAVLLLLVNACGLLITKFAGVVAAFVVVVLAAVLAAAETAAEAAGDFMYGFTRPNAGAFARIDVLLLIAL
jgi:hypothetical protein